MSGNPYGRTSKAKKYSDSKFYVAIARDVPIEDSIVLFKDWDSINLALNNKQIKTYKSFNDRFAAEQWLRMNLEKDGITAKNVHQIWEVVWAGTKPPAKILASSQNRITGKPMYAALIDDQPYIFIDWDTCQKRSNGKRGKKKKFLNYSLAVSWLKTQLHITEKGELFLVEDHTVPGSVPTPTSETQSSNKSNTPVQQYKPETSPGFEFRTLPYPNASINPSFNPSLPHPYLATLLLNGPPIQHNRSWYLSLNRFKLFYLYLKQFEEAMDPFIEINPDVELFYQTNNPFPFDPGHGTLPSKKFFHPLPQLPPPESIPIARTEPTIYAHCDGSSHGIKNAGTAIDFRYSQKVPGYVRDILFPKSYFPEADYNQIKFSHTMTEMISAIFSIQAAPTHNILIVVNNQKSVMDSFYSWLPGWRTKGWVGGSRKSVENQPLHTTLESLIAGRPGPTALKWAKNSALLGPEKPEFSFEGWRASIVGAYPHWKHNFMHSSDLVAEFIPHSHPYLNSSALSSFSDSGVKVNFQGADFVPLDESEFFSSDSDTEQESGSIPVPQATDAEIPLPEGAMSFSELQESVENEQYNSQETSEYSNRSRGGYSRGGYSRGGYRGKSRGGRGGYSRGGRGGYSRGGYRGKNRGGYSRGGYRGGRGKSRGGYKSKSYSSYGRQ